MNSKKSLHVSLAVTAVSLLFSYPITAQSDRYSAEAKELPPAAQAARVSITQGPELESADDNSAIIRWTSNNPGGSDEHYGVVHYGTAPTELGQTAKSHIRLNQSHSHTVFRVLVAGLKPRTTYYYTVDSMAANGRGDGVKSHVGRFTTPGPGERIVRRTISRTDLPSRRCIRRILPIIAMVITPSPHCLKVQQGRLLTRVSFRSADPSEVGRFSVGRNILCGSAVGAAAPSGPKDAVSRDIVYPGKRKIPG